MYTMMRSVKNAACLRGETVMIKEVRDPYGLLLGFIDDQGSRMVGKLYTGEVVGIYNKGRDVTEDLSFRTLCTGNGLEDLIRKNAK